MLRKEGYIQNIGALYDYGLFCVFIQLTQWSITVDSTVFTLWFFLSKSTRSCVMLHTMKNGVILFKMSAKEEEV